MVRGGGAGVDGGRIPVPARGRLVDEAAVGLGHEQRLHTGVGNQHVKATIPRQVCHQETGPAKLGPLVVRHRVPAFPERPGIHGDFFPEGGVLADDLRALCELPLEEPTGGDDPEE